jgi:hypothetical protein
MKFSILVSVALLGFTCAPKPDSPFTKPAFIQERADSVQVIPLQTKTNFKFKGLAIDAKNSMAYLGSWDKKEIIAISLTNFNYEVLKTIYSGRLSGMDCYIKNGIVYALMNEIDDNVASQSISVLLMFDMASKKLIRSYEAKGTGGRNHFNHVVVDSHGIAYVSNTLKSNILTVNTSNPGDSFKILVQHEHLSWVHGIDLSADETKLFTTSYEGGIKIFNLHTKTFSVFHDTVTAGDDGLKYYKGCLYGVGQNSLKRYTLDQAQSQVIKIDTLLNNHAYFNDPRCLAIENGILYCLANIEFDPVRFTRSQKPFSGNELKDTYLLRLPLDK